MMFRKDLSAVDQHVCDALLRMHMSQLPVLLFSNLIAASLMVYALWAVESHSWLLNWLVLHAISVVMVGFSIKAYTTKPLKHRSQTWIMYQIPWVMAFGSLWGAMPLFFLDVSNLYSVTMITIFLLSVLSATIYTFSLLPPFFNIFSSLLLIPYIIVLFINTALISIVVGTIILSALIAWISHEISRMLKQTLRMQFEKDVYAEKLLEARADAQQSALIAEYANESKNRFLASASHDLRQPLQAQRLFLASLEQQLTHTSDLTLLKQARRAELELGDMLDGLMDITRFNYGTCSVELSSIALEPLLVHLVKEMELIAAEAGLYLRMHLLPSVFVKSNAALLRRMLRNLISNALRYTKTGGVLVAMRKRGTDVRIEVWDSGVGIAEDELKSIFNEFYQVEGQTLVHPEESLGIGLATVKRLSFILKHSVEVHSRVGKGSCFFVTLPLGQPVDFLPCTDISSDQPDLSGLFVLVVDDQAAIRNGMRALLRGWGCEVLLAESGVKLLEELNLHPYPVPDALISDFSLPEESGLRVIQIVREHFQVDIPAFIVSGDMVTDVASVGKDIIACHWLKKPVDVDELSRHLGVLTKLNPD